MTTTIALALLATAAGQAVLQAEGPVPELADKLMLFGQFVGDWEFEVVNHAPSGPQKARGEWRFRWALEGYAVQDVWRFPQRAQGAPVGFGTTIRVYDKSIDAWRAVWVSAAAGVVYNFVARKVGADIAMEGTSPEGQPMRWIFSDVTPASFRWRGLTSKDGGKTWTTEQEMVVRRVGGEASAAGGR